MTNNTQPPQHPVGTSPQPIIHTVPRIPIMIDQHETRPETVLDLNGQPLYTVVDRNAQTQKMLSIFTTRDQAEKYCRSLVGQQLYNEPHPKASNRAGPPPGYGYVELYEHIEFDGCTWRHPDAEGTIPDFTEFLACGFLGIGRKNANDRISSVDCWTAFTYVVLAEHIHLGGSWLLLPGQAQVPSLVDLGWNDRASSLLFLSYGPGPDPL